MDRIRDFYKFIDWMRDAPSVSVLDDIMREVTDVLGFDQFALGHHVDLVRPPSNAIRLTSYHPSWINESLEQRFFVDDPVHAVSARLMRPFRWDELSDHILMTDHHRRILERARTFGLIGGITVPVRLTGEFEGSCSFATSELSRVHPLALALSHTTATFAFECARRLMRKMDGKTAEPVPHFTNKEREILILVGRGKTDAEIGQVLGISRNTAHQHVETGRRAYGNAQRTLMVIRAVFDGIINFADILR